MKGLLYILVFVFALDAHAGILFRRRSGGIFSGARRSGGVFRRRVGCIPGQCAQSGFYRNQGSRPAPRNGLPQSIEGGSDFGNSSGGHDLGGAQPQPSFAQPGVSDRPVAEPSPAADPEPSFDLDSAPASSTIKATDDDLAVPAPALPLSGTKGPLEAGTPAPAKERKKNANDTLKSYFEKKKEETNKKAEEWKTKILAALDKDSLKTVIRELLILDQSFLKSEEEELAFGKPLKEFSPQERKDLVTKYTQLQKELRDKLLTEVAEALKKNQNPKSLSVAESLIEIKKDHLDAYDRVIEEIKKGTIDTETTFCFTCDESRTIGSEYEGYTFGGAMEEAAARVIARLSEVRAEAPQRQEQPKATPEKPSSNSGSAAPRTQSAPAQPISPPASKPFISQAEKVARARIGSPVIKGRRAAGPTKRAFEQYMSILNGDPSLSDSTLRRFLNSGPHARDDRQYRATINGLSRDELLGAVSKFLDGEGPFNHCPSCNLGAGGRLSR